MWAGVQEVSRPMVMCHEMSQSRPTMMLVEPASIAVRVHGKAAARSCGRTAGISAAAVTGARDSIGRSSSERSSGKGIRISRRMGPGDRARSALVACDLIPYPLLLKEKGDDCDAAPAGPSLSFRRGTEGEVAGHRILTLSTPAPPCARIPLL